MLFRPAGSVRPDTFNPPPYVEGGTVRPSLHPAGIPRLDIFNLPCGGDRVVSAPLWGLRNRGDVSTCSVSGWSRPVVPGHDPSGPSVGLAPASGSFDGPTGAPTSDPGSSVRAMSQHTPVSSRDVSRGDMYSVGILTGRFMTRLRSLRNSLLGSVALSASPCRVGQ